MSKYVSVLEELCVARLHVTSAIIGLILRRWLVLKLRHAVALKKRVLISEHVGLRLKLLASSRSFFTWWIKWLLLHLLLNLIGSINIILLLLLELLKLLEGGNSSKSATDLLLDQALTKQDIDIWLHGLHILSFSLKLMYLLLHAVKLCHLPGDCLSLGFLVPLVLEDLLLWSAPECVLLH